MPRRKQKVKVERRLQITVQGIVYEAILTGEDAGVIVYGDALGDEEIQLDLSEIEQLAEFFEQVLGEIEKFGIEEVKEEEPERLPVHMLPPKEEESERMGGGQGRVKNPETDARLKGNEDLRPHDKDRAAQAEGGQRGGLARRRGRPPTRKQ